MHDTSAQVPTNSLEQYIQQSAHPVSPNVVRQLFKKLVSRDYKTIYKGMSWKHNEPETKEGAENRKDKKCFCKNGT